MDLSKIMTITGKPGLFKVIANTRTGLIVESIIDGKRFPVFASDRSSTLEDISIFTPGKDVPLKEVLWTIHEKKEELSIPGPKAEAGEIKDCFEQVLPDYDQDRVYVSDMKKVFAWYRLLEEKEMLSRPEEEEAGEAKETESEGREDKDPKDKGQEDKDLKDKE